VQYNYEIEIEGRVQGVGYRYFVRLRALELGITGFVRNSPDGRVIVLAEGDQKDLDTFLDYLRTGPPLARIRQVTVARSPFTGLYESFNIRI